MGNPFSHHILRNLMQAQIMCCRITPKKNLYSPAFSHVASIHPAVPITLPISEGIYFVTMYSFLMDISSFHRRWARKGNQRPTGFLNSFCFIVQGCYTSTSKEVRWMWLLPLDKTDCFAVQGISAPSLLKSSAAWPFYAYVDKISASTFSPPTWNVRGLRRKVNGNVTVCCLFSRELHEQTFHNPSLIYFKIITPSSDNFLGSVHWNFCS